MAQRCDLIPEELLFVGIVRLAIRDARQEKNQRLQEDAKRFLWEVAPVVAERAERIATDKPLLSEAIHFYR